MLVTNLQVYYELPHPKGRGFLLPHFFGTEAILEVNTRNTGLNPYESSLEYLFCYSTCQESRQRFPSSQESFMSLISN